MVPVELTLPCPFIIAGVERPLDIVLSISIRVLLILREEGERETPCDCCKNTGAKAVQEYLRSFVRAPPRTSADVSSHIK